MTVADWYGQEVDHYVEAGDEAIALADGGENAAEQILDHIHRDDHRHLDMLPACALAVGDLVSMSGLVHVEWLR